MATKLTIRLAPKTAKDFATPQRARTEALRALAVWQARAKGRRFSIIECKDDFVITRLTWRSDDPVAAQDLGSTCDARLLEGQALEAR